MEALRRHPAPGPQPELSAEPRSRVIWDGSPIHRAKVIKDFLKRGAAKQLHLERLPGYAPELNPQEGVWNLLKRAELKNVCCRDVPHVAQELRRAIDKH